jgi:hypothetical protein
MTPAEQAAFEQVLNTWLQHAIVIFAIGYWLHWGWRKLRLPGIDLRRYWTWAPREGADNLSTNTHESSSDSLLATPIAQHTRLPLQPVVMPNNDDNEALIVADTVAEDEEPDQVDRAVALALARLIVASDSKPFSQGRLGETRAIEVAFSCARSSDPSSTYQGARVLLKEALEELCRPAYRRSDDAGKPVP